MKTLAIKYRPNEFEDVCGQGSVVEILSKQVETETIKNSYLFCGPSGTGKTTLARIFANKINNGAGTPIEIDGASNNGVDNIRQIIDDARQLSLDSKYKVYIIDEAHGLTNQSWQALLKLIEEPPRFTIFIFCTTDPQKIPATIINRVQRYNLASISKEKIIERLKYICDLEGFYNYNDGIEYIANMSEGSMRQAITWLDKCSCLSKEISSSNVIYSLGDLSLDSFFEITNAIIDGNCPKVCEIIDTLQSKGNDLKLFVDQYLKFVLDLSLYCYTKEISVTNIPLFMKEKLDYTTGIQNNTSYFSLFQDKILELKQMLKGDNSASTTIKVRLMTIARGM